MRFADLHLCPDLVVAARAYIEQYFTDVVSSEEFLQLECRQVVEFISSDQLTVSSEEKVISNDMQSLYLFLLNLCVSPQEQITWFS